LLPRLLRGSSPLGSSGPGGFQIMTTATININALTATARSIVAKRGVALDARITPITARPCNDHWQLEAEAFGDWFWLSLLVDGRWHMISRRRDPRELLSVASTITPASLGGWNFQEE
jgi:hypothetical protein